ncbi:division/cell wall cluster transcriptional repressor MraZ [Sphingomonas sp. M1-B02]|uniref:division/cell wall cluster transcriptional repressor MraZ n=1 Tax=Sphingomonas sp. M1-B02 TaxID=3114300 RepID=UPI002240AF3D|nr:division/cell wall cluster transcriptional repressor MraZ [Sphingomonas sp. S6-11]UZK67396.1 division/cell wall cluster transcriptional repressor MraZ [Sphingomonas sp. S6-11]
MADRELFEGFALQAVDLKGRVAIPADLRAAAERNSDIRQIVVGYRAEDGCLSAHDLSWSKEKYERIDRREQIAVDRGDEADRSAKRRAFGQVEKAPFDDSGRFVIPPFFKMKAGIQKWAFFNGNGETFDIWAPEVLLKDDRADPGLREICEFLCHSKGVKL